MASSTCRAQRLALAVEPRRKSRLDPTYETSLYSGVERSEVQHGLNQYLYAWKTLRGFPLHTGSAGAVVVNNSRTQS